MTHLRICLVLAVLSMPISVMAQEWTLESLKAEALSKNVSIKTAIAEAEMSKFRFHQEIAWESPELGVDTHLEWMASQKIPLSEKKDIQGQIAIIEQQIAKQSLRHLILTVITKLRKTYSRYANATYQLKLTKKNIALWQETVSILQTQYEVGTLKQTDLLAAKTEIANLSEKQVDLEQEITDLGLQLGELIGQDAIVKLNPPAPLIGNPIDSPTLSHNPEYRMAELSVEKTTLEEKWAQKQGIPDLILQAKAKNLQEWSLGVALELPWFRREKWEALNQEAAKKLEKAKFEREATQRSLQKDLQIQQSMAQTLHHHIMNIQTKILPLRQQTTDRMRKQYENNQASFTEFLTSQRDLQETESMLASHITNYDETLFELERLTGKEGGSK